MSTHFVHTGAEIGASVSVSNVDINVATIVGTIAITTPLSDGQPPVVRVVRV